MNERIRKILEAAIRAPSGDNCQPWRFVIMGDRVDLYDDPAADTSYYNYRQRASLVAHGALLENVALTAPTLGFETTFNLFPTPDNPCHVAQITFVECPATAVTLEPYIAVRATNRKRYQGGLLNETRLAAMNVASADLPNVRGFLTNKRQDLDRLSEVVCLSDQLVFENRRLHNFLFEHIRWSDEEAEKCRDGLDIKTLELNALDTLGFKILKNWWLTSLLGKVGVSRLVAGNARKLARSASAIGVILGSDSQNPVTYLQGGSLLQRIWLQATKMGLSFHPMSGICFLMQRVADRQADDLSPTHVELIRKAVGKVAVISGTPEPNVISLFRVGLADPPRVRSQRLDMCQFLHECEGEPG